MTERRGGEGARATALRALERADEATAIAALVGLAGTLDERAALAAVQRRRRARGLELTLALRAAALHAERGEEDRALALLVERPEAAALVAASDLREASGDRAAALALVERALAQNVDEPGARARRERLRAALGRSSSAPDANPTLLGAHPEATNLRIVREAGRGGAATVYEAFDEALGRRVALKAYHRPAPDREQLLREARTAVLLAGPGIIRVWDVDLERGTLACEWAAAGSLRDAIVAGDAARLLPVTGWLLPLLDALSSCHDAGIVHGDVKPGNVLFLSPGQPVLADFGHAGRADEAARGGTRGYLSPERLASATLAPADDVFALARVAQEVGAALTGRAAIGEGCRELLTRAAALGLASERPRGARALAVALGVTPAESRRG